MNNSQLQLEPVEDTTTVKVSEREAALVRIIEALQVIKGNSAWSTLKTEILDSLVIRLKSNLLTEAKKENPDTNKLNRITGELLWATRFSDFDKYESELRVELKAIRLRLYGK